MISTNSNVKVIDKSHIALARSIFSLAIGVPRDVLRINVVHTTPSTATGRTTGLLVSTAVVGAVLFLLIGAVVLRKNARKN